MKNTVSTNAWYIILFGCALIIIAYYINESQKSNDKNIKPAFSEFQRDSIARARADATISGIFTKNLPAAENYVNNFRIEDQKYLTPFSYMEICRTLNDYYKVGSDGEKFGLPDAKSRGIELQKNIKTLRWKILPTLRKWWAEELERNMRDKRISVRCYGKRNSGVEFTGRKFKSKYDIENDFENKNLAFNLLRFQEVRYQYPGDTRYTVYTTNVDKDNE